MRIRVTIETEASPGSWIAEPLLLTDVEPGAGRSDAPEMIATLGDNVRSYAQALAEIPHSDLALALAAYHFRARARREGGLSEPEKEAYERRANNGRSQTVDPLSTARLAMTLGNE
jgi:hypothetical protein